MPVRFLLWFHLGHWNFCDTTAMHAIWGCSAGPKRKLFKGGCLHMGTSANRTVLSILGQMLPSVINFMLQTGAISSLARSSLSLMVECSVALKFPFFIIPFFLSWPLIYRKYHVFLLLLPSPPHTFTLFLSIYQYQTFMNLCITR